MRSDFSIQRAQSAIGDAIHATGTAAKHTAEAIKAFPGNVYDACTRPRASPLAVSERVDALGLGFASAVANVIPGTGWILSAIWGGGMAATGCGEARAKGYEILGTTAATIVATGVAMACGFPFSASALVAGAFFSSVLTASTIIDARRGQRGDIG